MTAMDLNADALASPHRIVLASAGSGKTFQLTNVFLRLLLAGEAPDGLLATTFTRAAAGEILRRTLARLSDAVVDDAALGELREHVDPNLTHEQCARTLERVVASFHRLSAMTIDAWFARLASSFSFELGLAPGWRMLEEEEDESLRAEAVDRAMREAPKNDMFDLLRALEGEKIRVRAHRAIMDVVKQGHAAYLETLSEAAPWSAIKPIGRLMNREAIQEAVQQLQKLDLPETKAGAPRKVWVGALKKMIEKVQAGDWDGFASLTLVVRVITGEAQFGGADIEEAHRSALAPLIDHARRVLTQVHANRTVAARDLLEQFDDQYTELKRARGGMTFADPPRLLLESATTDDLQHLYYRLDATIRHLLLDEFQDTSMTQYRILEPVLDELLSQASDGRSVLCVGDDKQSLYAWRQAEPALLGALAGRWSTWRSQTLAKSWRSSPIVLDAVNELFSDAQANRSLQTAPPALRAAEEWDARFEPHTAAHTTLTGSARLTVANDPKVAPSSATQEDRAVLETCVDRVAEARQRAPGASIAVLVRRGADLVAILGMLKRRGVDASERRGNPLVDAPPVAVAASMLRLIDHPGHTAALYHVATSPLGKVVGLTMRPAAVGGPADELGASCLPLAPTVRQVAADYRRRFVEFGCAPALSHWLNATASSMDSRGFGRFEQFIDLAQEFDAAGRGGPADLAAIAETRRIDQPGAAPVRVMTIHGAKGLEFDVVVLPLVGVKSWQVNCTSILMARDTPLGPVTRVSRYPNAALRALDPALADLHEHALQREINEELCCLYVAATRAKRCLEMVVPTDKAGREGEPIAPDKWSLRPAHFVRAALAPDSPATPGATLWSRGEIDDWAHDENLAHIEAPRAPAKAVELQTRPSQRRSAARLAIVSPSQSSQGALISADALLTRGDQAARERGDLMHLWFELIDWLDAAAPNDAELRDAARRAGYESELIDALAPRFRHAIDAEPIQTLLSKAQWATGADAAHEVTAYHERSFALRVKTATGDRLEQGRFDRLVVGRTNGVAVRAQIVDYKTDQGAAGLSGDALGAYAQRHRPQMEAYRRATCRLLGLDESGVEVTLVFTAAGQTVRLEPLDANASPNA